MCDMNNVADVLCWQVIPSLERLFLLIGVNVRSWYSDLPRSAVKARQDAFTNPTSRREESRSIDSYYMSKHCRLCGEIGMDTLCHDCTNNPQRSLLALHTAAYRQEEAVARLRLACYACGDRDSFESCINTTCGVWNRIRLVENDKVTL